ncbi:MAG: DMT family transporter [Clostridia bacterium]|nr:DMT family transporter [Clostridia bacterium]
MSNKLKVGLCAYGAVIIWSLAFIGTKIGLEYFDPVTLSIYRYLAAGVFALILCAAGKKAVPARRDIPLFLLLGATGYFLYVLTFNMGAGGVSVSAASVIISIAPITTAVFSSVLFKEKMSARQLAAALIEFAGVAVVSFCGGENKAGSGVLWIVASLVCFTTYNLLTRYAAGKYTPLQITGYGLIAAFAMFLPMTPYAAAHTQKITVGGVLCVLLLGVICSGAAYVLWAKALAKSDGTLEAANALFLEPIITTLLGIFMLGEHPNLQMWIGIGIVAAGLCLFYAKVKTKKGVFDNADG